MIPGEEWFDVVDEQDEVLRQAPRAEVHRMGWRHRAVHILVRNSAGQIYLQKRSWRKDCHPCTWDTSCSGHVDAGETYEIAAVRELKEELGIQCEAPPTPCFKIGACEGTGWEFTWVYQMDWVGAVTPDPMEIETGDWFAPEVIQSWILRRRHDFAPAFLAVWEGWNQPGT